VNPRTSIGEARREGYRLAGWRGADVRQLITPPRPVRHLRSRRRWPPGDLWLPRDRTSLPKIDMVNCALTLYAFIDAKSAPAPLLHPARRELRW